MSLVRSKASSRRSCTHTGSSSVECFWVLQQILLLALLHEKWQATHSDSNGITIPTTTSLLYTSYHSSLSMVESCCAASSFFLSANIRVFRDSCCSFSFPTLQLKLQLSTPSHHLLLLSQIHVKLGERERSQPSSNPNCFDRRKMEARASLLRARPNASSSLSPSHSDERFMSKSLGVSTDPMLLKR